MTERLKKHRGKIVTALLILVAVVWYLIAHRGELNRETLMEYGKSIHGPGFIAAFMVLPVFGFPISIFLILAGVRFGLAGGMAVSAVAILFHHFAAYRIAHGFFRDRLRARLDRAGYGIPPIDPKHRVWFTALFAALHGPPYVAKLYLLAITDIPLAIYLWIGAPVYIAFCIVPVGAGSAVVNFNPTWIYILTGISALLLLIGYWLRHRFADALKG
jgi:uncharacterized membrane protein YdjX (TVP38/TMEM64 family)